METPPDPDLRQQIEELAAVVAANRTRLEELTDRADVSLHRADVAEQRADDMELRADVSERRVDALEARSAVDREMIAELQADGVLASEHVTQLETALVTSRVIGAAIGILMASRNIGEHEALTLLKGASQRSNTKLRDVAATILAGADAIR